MKRLCALAVIIAMVMSLIYVEVAFCQTSKSPKVSKSVLSAPSPATTNMAFPTTVEATSPNAKLVRYAVGYNTYWLLIPDNIVEYKYLAKYPFTAFLFINWFNETKIDQLSVTTLMKGSLVPSGDFYYILAFDKIEGFRDTAEKIKNLDEFGMSDKKIEVITKLKECYRNYLEEYNKYLKGVNGHYVFKNGKFSNSRTIMSEYPHGLYTAVTTDKINQAASTVSRSDYNFDSKTITLELLGPIANSGMEDEGMWERQYRSKFYENHKTNLPENITVPMSIDDAKKLFGNEDKAFCVSYLAVKPRFGFFGYVGTITQRVMNFDVLKIGKKCFRKDTGWESPVLMFEITSTPGKPLY